MPNEEIIKICNKIEDGEQLLGKNFEDWSTAERNMFGNHEELRAKLMHLRNKLIYLRDEQLRKNEEQIRELQKKRGLSTDTEIAASDFLGYIPPMIEFSSTRINSTTSNTSNPRPHSKEPTSVVPWDDFLYNAQSFRLESSALFAPGCFVKFVAKAADEYQVISYLLANIFNPVNKLLIATGSKLLFTGRCEIVNPVLKGWPDHVLHENGELKSFMETKTIWDLPTPANNETVAQWWHEDVEAENSELVRQNSRPSVFHIIGQVYGYLLNHALKYGMLTNGQVVWFLCRPNVANAPSNLLISPPISLVGESPTIFQSIMYLVSLVMRGHNSVSSPETSPKGVALPSKAINSEQKINDIPDDLDLSQLNEKIGDGYCGNVVKYTMSDGTEIALKCCDINNNKEGYRMMKNEVKIYQKLKELQGTVVPTLRFSGFYGETYLIGTDYIKGKHPERNESLVDVIKNLKKRLAAYKIEHGDLRDMNILIDQSGNHWVLDFGKSKLID